MQKQIWQLGQHLQDFLFKTMRILLVTPYFYPHKGGSQAYAEELYATLMKEDRSMNVDVLTYNTDKSKSVEQYRGFTIYRIPCIQILPGQFAVPNYIEVFKTLSMLFKKNHYDFINSHTRFFESTFWVPFAARFFGTKSVLTDHCANHPTHTSSVVTKISYLVDKLFVPLILTQYNQVTVTNTATKKFIQSLSKKETHIIYGGVDTKYFKNPTRRKTRKIKGIHKTFQRNDVVISFVGRMIHSKGPQLLLKSAETITKKHRNVYFVFGGNGLLYKELSKSANKKIFFLGELEKKEIASLLSRTNILVHPSLHHEGFPNVILEAGAAGCAVIATNMGGTYEIIKKDTGVLTKPSVKDITAKIEYLIQNKKERLTYGKNIREWIEKSYDWKKISKEYVTFIQEKLTKKSLFPTVRAAGVPRN